MSRYSVTPDRLLDRAWRSGHPFRPRSGRLRRWVMMVLLVTLSLIIGGYNYLTDSNRVRSMAETYLSRLVGGRVEVGGATLSIFEGLRLDDVKVHVDEETGASDSVVFAAQSFIVTYDPRNMLAGKLEATQIIAQKPRVQLVENLDTGTWNFYRLGQHRQARPRAPMSMPAKPPPLPELFLRNASVEISEMRQSQIVDVGYLAIDGQLTPASDGEHYQFELQSRGVQGVGPFASGTIEFATGEIITALRNFEFGKNMRSVLPAATRDWLDRHELAGRLDIPRFVYSPGRPGGKPGFKVEMDLNGVNLAVRPEEWMSAVDARHVHNLESSVESMQPLFAAAGYRPHRRVPGPIDRLADLVQMSPIRLQQVAGVFVFTEDGITIDALSGRVENNGFKISGRIDGYNPDAAAHLQISSLDGENLYLPAAPHYLNSLPREVREWYEQVHPQGDCTFVVALDRPVPGALPVIEGRMDIVDGQFNFAQFPYPLRDVSGRIAFTRDEKLGQNFIKIIGIRGHGVPGGPNADCTLRVDGEVGPLGPETPDPGVTLYVSANGIASEPTLRQAFPPEVQLAFHTMDAEGRGRYPTFRGNFVSTIQKAIASQHWTFDTDVTVDDASVLVPDFPYPLQHLTGLLKVRDGYVDLDRMTMRRAGANLTMSGRIRWDHPVEIADSRRPSATSETPDGASLATDLRLVARDLPIDDSLLQALPSDRRLWLKKVGMLGKLDIDGDIRQTWIDPKPVVGDDRTPVNYDFEIGLHDGMLRREGEPLVASDLIGKMHLTNDHLEIHELHARRGPAEVVAAGSVDLAGENPRIAISATAKELLLDHDLYALLPAAARKMWDNLEPDGTLDAEVAYGGFVGDGKAPTTARCATNPTAAPTLIADAGKLGAKDYPPPTVMADPQANPIPAQITDGFRGTFRPRNLAITPRALSYRLDRLGGTISVTQDQVTLEDVSAHHGAATLTASGTGAIAVEPNVWQLRLGGSNIPVDDALRKALPPTILNVVDSLKLHGNVGFSFPKLTYRATNPQPQIDLAATIDIDKGNLDVGVPLTDVNGQFQMDVSARDGRLCSLTGGLDLSSLTMAGRLLRGFRAELTKPAGQSELQMAKIQAQLAGGGIAGQIALAFPDDGPSRYALAMVLRDADVKELARESDADIRGRLTASLSLEGSWDDVSTRRGRGDVLVEGKEMYRLPLIMGLLQVTNLSLPITKPFNQGSAQYSIEGQRVTFEKIEVRSPGMLIHGGGHLDFDTKQVRMTFTTDNPNGLKVPFLNDLFNGAREELLRINVRGTIKDPKVEPSMMGTFTTTIDEVFRGDAKK